MSYERTPESYLLPRIVLEVVAGDTAEPGWLSGAAVGSWTLDRELVASTIPGNIRERNGLSIGAASVTVRPSRPSWPFGERVTPWAPTVAARVTTGVPVNLYAEDPAGGPGGPEDPFPLGAWVTDETDGTLSEAGIQVDLLEGSYAGRDVPALLPPYSAAPFTPGMPVDPVWPISRLLEQIGFPATPAPASGAALLAVPMDGAIHATAQAPGAPYSVTGEIAGGWTTMGERGLLAGGSGSSITAVSTLHTAPVSQQLADGGTVVYTLDVVGTVYLVDVVQGWLIRIVNEAGTHSIAVANDLDAVGNVQPFAGRQSAVWPDRVQVQVQRDSITTVGNWTELRARARSGPDAPWSAVSTDTADALGRPTFQEAPRVVGGVPVPGVPGIPASPAAGQFAGLVVTAGAWDDEPHPGLWAEPRAILQPLGGPGVDAGLPWSPAGDDAWQVIQDYASANLGGVIIGLDGIARVLTRADLAGATDTPDTAAAIDVGAEFDDLPWTLDPDDSADRVEVTYTPPAIVAADLGSSTLAPIAWQADDVISLAAGATVTILAVFDNLAAVGVFEDFVTPTDPSPWWSRASTVIAFDNPDGAGTPLPRSALQVSVVQTSATTATVKLENRHGGRVYLVDGNGNPCLILRARAVATFETPQVVELGASKAAAQRPLEVNLTPYVQSRAQARVIAEHLWSRVTGTGLWKASTVRCRLDWSLDIGQVRPLVHADTELGVQVLVTKVHYDGSPEAIAQSIDVVLVPWTYVDFATHWTTHQPGATYADFAAAQAARTYADHTNDPLWTGA